MDMDSSTHAAGRQSEVRENEGGERVENDDMVGRSSWA